MYAPAGAVAEGVFIDAAAVESVTVQESATLKAFPGKCTLTKVQDRKLGGGKNSSITARTDFHRIGQIRAPIVPYVWIRRQGSVTNSGRDDEATLWHFRRNLMVTEENKGNPDKYAGMVTRTCYDTYFMCVGIRTGKEMKKKIADEFRPWIIPRIGEFGKVSDDIMKQLVDVSRYELVEPFEKIPEDPQTVLDWVNEIIRGGN